MPAVRSVGELRDARLHPCAAVELPREIGIVAPRDISQHPPCHSMRIAFASCALAGSRTSVSRSPFLMSSQTARPS